MERKSSKSFTCVLKPLDYLLILLGLAVCVVSVVRAATKETGRPLLVVTSPTAEYVYPLDRDDIIHIQGLEGTTEIQIQRGQASYLNSPCANKTCMAAPPVHRNGDWSACLPNGIFMRVESQEPATSDDIDIIAF